MFIAVKNGANKGVYRKSDFRNEWRTEGVSIKNFRSSKLNEALKWAGVTKVKGATSDEVITKKSKSKLRKDNKEMIVHITGINKKHINSLKLILSEIDSGTSKFTDTPFYLGTDEYKLNFSQPADEVMVERIWAEYDIASDFLEYTNERLDELREVLKSKESEFKDYQSYLEWKGSPEGVEYQESIRLKLHKIIKDKKYKSYIVSLIKNYESNKKIFNESISNIKG